MNEETERKIIRTWAWFVYALVVIYLAYGVYILVYGVNPQ